MERGTDRALREVLHGVPRTSARPWLFDGLGLPDLKIIPGGATGSTAGISVDSGHTAVRVSPPAAGEEVPLRTVIGDWGGRWTAPPLFVAPG